MWGFKNVKWIKITVSWNKIGRCGADLTFLRPFFVFRLSQYLTRSQSAGATPPQETGYTLNSWYGKHHHEMRWWHQTHFALWQRPALLQRSDGWFRAMLPNATAYAANQGYEGARWPKMVGPANTAQQLPTGADWRRSAFVAQSVGNTSYSDSKWPLLYWYGTFWPNFHHFDRFELDLRGHMHVWGAAFSCLRFKWADVVLI